jgi:hypothetical protein
MFNGVFRTRKGLKSFHPSQLIVADSNPISTFTWEGIRCGIIRSNPAQYVYPPLETDLLFVTENSIEHPSELPSTIRYNELIIAGKYDFYRARTLAMELNKMGYKVHNVKEDGHWLLDLNKKTDESGNDR